MPAPPAHSPSPPASQTLAGEQARRFVDAQRRIDLLRGLHHNAGEAAFPSLMAGRPPGREPGTSPTPPPFATAAFEHSVAATLHARNGRLPLADRIELIRHAAHLGLSRFDANLLMARVEHYAGRPANRQWHRPTRWQPRSGLLLGACLLVGLLLIQGGLVLLWTLLLARGS